MSALQGAAQLSLEVEIPRPSQDPRLQTERHGNKWQRPLRVLFSRQVEGHGGAALWPFSREDPGGERQQEEQQGLERPLCGSAGGTLMGARVFWLVEDRHPSRSTPRQ